MVELACPFPPPKTEIVVGKDLDGLVHVRMIVAVSKGDTRELEGYLSPAKARVFGELLLRAGAEP